MHRKATTAAMVTPKGTPRPTPIFDDNARTLDDNGRLGCDNGRPVDVMVGVADEEEGAADKEVVAVKIALEVINAMTCHRDHAQDHWIGENSCRSSMVDKSSLCQPRLPDPALDLVGLYWNFYTGLTISMYAL